MYRALLLITALLLCACATEWHIRRSDNGKTALRLQSVRNSTLPENGLTFIRPSDLRAGDILFSSESSIRSLGIRVFSNAAVSHSFIYLGDGNIAEAVGSGTRIRALDEALQETNLTVAFRRPDLTAENIQAIIAFAEEKNGSGDIELDAPRITDIDSLTAVDALKLGLAQAFALIPGTSRSGATIIGGMIFGLSRQGATEFSFYLAIPTLIGASVYDTWKSRDLLSAGDIPLFAVGTIFAFFSALACVHWLIRFVASNSFRVFAWYRVIFGLLILAVTYTGLLHWGSAMD